MKSEFEKKFYPVVVVGEKGEIVSRNRLAKKLLPPPSGLRELIAKIGERKGDFAFLETLESVPYFIARIPLEKGKICLCFLENFIPLYEPFSEMALEGISAFFWKLLEQREESEKELAKPGFLDALAARTFRLRREEKSFLRLIKMRHYKRGERVSCSLSGLFSHLRSAVEENGVRLSLSVEEKSAVLLSTQALAFLVLNVILFAHLYEGADEVLICSEERDKNLDLTFSFADLQDFHKVWENLFCTQQSEIPGALFSTPLFCVLSLCEKEEIPWKFYEEKGKLVFTASLPLAVTLPAAFLADSDSQEILDLLYWEKEFFSR